MKPLLCTASVVRNLLNTEVGSWPPRPIEPSKPHQWQDRRIAKPQPNEVGFGKRAIVRPYCTGTEWPLAYYEMRGSCWNSSGPLVPPLKVGDVFYVRETWMPGDTSMTCDSVQILYKADNDIRPDGVSVREFGCVRTFQRPYEEVLEFKRDVERMEVTGDKWRPSIHMPKWASRIHLEVMRVGVERVCDISVPDCIAEGIACTEWDAAFVPKNAFYTLWTKLYGPDAWEKFCWVYDLKRIK